MAKTFRGGTHPEGMKHLSRDRAIEAFPLPDEARILMSQHLGAPCKPCVEKGQRVLTGQVVGEAQGFVSAPVHASVTGTVKEIGEAPNPVTGKACPAVVIERDGDDEWAEGANAEQDADSFDADELRSRIFNAGVVGLGGATFPTHVKLSPPQDKPIDKAILNAAECEPYLTCDERLMLERPEDVVRGFRYIMRALGVEAGTAGIESNKPEAAEKLVAVAESEGVPLAVEVLPVKYPQGAEGQLIKALFGREIPWKGGLPMEVGCVVQNVATVVAVYEAVRFNRPLIQRVCTVTGDGVDNPMNAVVRLGTPLEGVLAKAGLRADAAKLILGGPMMGIAQRTENLWFTKGMGGVLVLRDATIHESGPCIRCGRCVDACPCGLTPALVSRAMDAGDLDACMELNVLECKQCGCCTYVCPSKRPLMHQIKVAIDELRKRKSK